MTRFANWTTETILLSFILGLSACTREAAPAPPPSPAAVAETRDNAQPVEPTPDEVGADSPAEIPRNAVRLRLMAANLTTGNHQNYDLGHGLRILQGAKPDIVMIQEFNYRSHTNADLASLAEGVMGGRAYFYREEGEVPNGVISRYPIRSSGEWDDPEVANRDFAWACIDIPGPVDLWVVSVHFLTSRATVRESEAAILVSAIEDFVPDTAYLAIAGDFNTKTKNESCYATLRHVVVTDGPHPADHDGNPNTNADRSKAYDAILVDGDLHRFRAPVVIGSELFPHGLVLDPRVFTPIDAIAPATAEDASAPAMQHMGVLRDFLIPGEHKVGE